MDFSFGLYFSIGGHNCNLLAIAVIVLSIVCYIADDEPMPWKILRNLFISMLVATLVVVATPSTKTMIAIKVIPLIANDKDIRAIPKLFLKYTKEWLQEELSWGTSKQVENE